MSQGQEKKLELGGKSRLSVIGNSCKWYRIYLRDRLLCMSVRKFLDTFVEVGRYTLTAQHYSMSWVSDCVKRRRK